MMDSTQTRLSYSLTNDLTDTLFHYDVPISLKLMMNDYSSKVHSITQGNKTMPFFISSENGANYLNFDAVPNGSHIVLHMPNPAGIQDFPELAKGAVNYPNPFTTASTIVLDLPEAENVELLVYDQIGRQLRNYSNFYPAGRNNIEFNGSGLAPGVYNCIIRTRERIMDVSMAMTH
jgi:hypothetical protein